MLTFHNDSLHCLSVAILTQGELFWLKEKSVRSQYEVMTQKMLKKAEEFEFVKLLGKGFFGEVLRLCRGRDARRADGIDALPYRRLHTLTC